MALDRQSIEKKDFPVGRRGYDPEAVDAHLSTLADEIADYKRSARRRSDTLASESTSAMLSRVDAMETELGALVDSLRTGGNRLNADLQLLESGLSEVSDVIRPRPRFEPEPEPEPEPVAAEPEPEEAVATELPAASPSPSSRRRLRPRPSMVPTTLRAPG